MSTRRSLAYSFMDRYAGLTITVVSSMVIARLLTPAEIGVFSVTMVLLMFTATVRDLGAGQYMIQEKDLTIERIRAVWAVQLGLGVGLGCIVLLASYPVASFYNEPRMHDIMMVVALNYVINPFGSLTHAWLMREMRFESSALIRVSGGLAGALVSTWLAWQNHGPISLAYGSLATTLVSAMMAIYYRPKFFPWLPGVSEIRRVLVFGSQLTASSVVTTFAASAPELFLGKLQNLSSVGYYSRASGLVQMFHRLFVDAVGAVCLPWFAKQSREQGGIVEPFLKATLYVTAFGWSFCLAIICLAHPIIRVLYGNQWDQSADLARLLGMAMAFSVPAALCSTALLSVGAATTIAKVTVLSAFQGVIFVAVGATQGLMILGMALVASACVSSALWLHATARHIDLPLLSLLRSLCRSLTVALLSAVGPVLTLWIYGAYPADVVLPLMLGGVSGLVGFVAGLFIFKHPLHEELLGVIAKL